MPKRSLHVTEEDERPIKRKRPLRHDNLSGLSDELILRVLSHLTVQELNLCQRLSHKFKSIATDSQLWKAHYYNRFVRPRASRIPGIRPTTDLTASSHLHFSSKLSRWLDEQNLVRGGAKTDWKRQYKLRHNWARGACHVSKIEVAERPTVPPLQLRLHKKTVYSVDSNGGLRAWSMTGQKGLIAETKLGPASSAPTTIAIDTQSLDENPPLVVVGFENGAFRVFQLQNDAGRFNEVYAHAASSNGVLVAVAFSFPYLLTMTAGQLLSLYKFSEALPTAKLDPPRILQSLRSQTVSQPVSLSIRANTTGITASIAYAVPTIFNSGWSVGLQEMRLTTEGKLVESRLAASVIDKILLPPTIYPVVESNTQLEADEFRKPTSLSYNHPYLLVSHEDNTLTLYLATSDQSTLSIGPGKRLWGHTSAVSAAHVGGRGRAVSVSQKGGELRVWELEKTISSKSRRGKYSDRISVLVRPEHNTIAETNSKRNSLAMANITEAIRRRGDGLGLALEERFDESCMNRGLVGFDEENVVVLREQRGGSQALVVYDFT